MAYLHISLLLLSSVFIGWSAGHPERPTLIDPGQARQLFQMADNSSADHDGRLTLVEVEEIFTFFDENGDNVLQRTEFMTEWIKNGLGDQQSAYFLFDNTDTDQDGSITVSPDLGRVFHYFDLDGDDLVSEVEFVVVWSSLSA